MKLTLVWESDKRMRAVFSNIGNANSNDFYLLMVFHESRKGGFNREITQEECARILTKENLDYVMKPEIIIPATSLNAM